MDHLCCSESGLLRYPGSHALAGWARASPVWWLASSVSRSRAGLVTRRADCAVRRHATSGAFVDWLLAFGKREPGHTLCPSSDDLTYLYALHRENSPTLQPLSAGRFGGPRSSDKKRLYEAALKVAWLPRTRISPRPTPTSNPLGVTPDFPSSSNRAPKSFRTRCPKACCWRTGRFLQKYRNTGQNDDFGAGCLRHGRTSGGPCCRLTIPRGRIRFNALSGFLDKRRALRDARSMKVLAEAAPAGDRALL